MITGTPARYEWNDGELIKFAGVKVVWNIYPELEAVYVYTSRREVKICIESDVCSAKPVLPEFEIGVDVLLG